MDFMKSMQISSSALTAQRTKMNVISENLANSETTKTEDGTPYNRKMVVMESKSMNSFKETISGVEKEYTGVEVSEVVSSQEDFRLVYNPAHPDADPNTGYVRMPNVNVMTEMADLMVARRSYDANVTVVNNTKSMVAKALEIGK